MFSAFLERAYRDLDEPLRVALWVGTLKRILSAHIEFEEKEVLPLYRRRVPDPPVTASAENFLRDHDLIRERVQELRDLAIQCAYKAIDRSLLRQLVATLDELLHHHDVRETEHLYPLLKNSTTEEERRELLVQLESVPLRLPDDEPEVTPVLGSALLERLGGNYRTWLRLQSSASELLRWIERTSEFKLDSVPEPLPRRALLDKLLQRDRRLVHDFAHRDPAGIREFALEECKVDRTLRTTIWYGIEALHQEQ